jgi:hypothetical protein
MGNAPFQNGKWFLKTLLIVDECKKKGANYKQGCFLFVENISRDWVRARTSLVGKLQQSGGGPERFGWNYNVTDSFGLPL